MRRARLLMTSLTVEDPSIQGSFRPPESFKVRGSFPPEDPRYVLLSIICTVDLASGFIERRGTATDIQKLVTAKLKSSDGNSRSRGSFVVEDLHQIFRVSLLRLSTMDLTSGLNEKRGTASNVQQLVKLGQVRFSCDR
jgi:hypothetical protein